MTLTAKTHWLLQIAGLYLVVHQATSNILSGLAKVSKGVAGLGRLLALSLVSQYIEFLILEIQTRIPEVYQLHFMRLVLMEKLSLENCMKTFYGHVQETTISFGLIGDGTKNARIAGMLRNLSSYYYKEDNLLFCVPIAQGLVYIGKELLTLAPYHLEGFLLSFLSKLMRLRISF